MTILEVDDLRTVFHTDDGLLTAVDGVSFSLGAGEILGLVGESGSGKSVTAFSIMRLINSPGEISSGKVYFDGKDLLSLDNRSMRQHRGKRLSMIFQEPLSSLNPVHTIGAQVMEALKIHTRLSRRESHARAVAMLERVGIADAKMRMSAYPHQLSGGLRQRVMIALALVCEPDILIADEPTTALDVTIQAQILALLKELQAEYGMSIILITHDLGVIAEIADRVCVMYAGQITETAPIELFFDSTAHPYSAALIGSIPDRKIERHRLSVIEGGLPSLDNMPVGCRFSPRCRFAKDDCANTPQRLVEYAAKHQVACMRAEHRELPDNLIDVNVEQRHV